MNRLLVVFVLLAVWPAVTLHGQGGKKRLTVELVAHPEALVSPGIQRIAWCPGSDQISYIRPQGSGPMRFGETRAQAAVTMLWIYDVASGKERELLRDTGSDPNLAELFRALGAGEYRLSQEMPDRSL